MIKLFEILMDKVYYGVRYINKNPIIILGNQKSGTSALAFLLAEYGGLSKTIDIPEMWWPTLRDLNSGELSLYAFVDSHRNRFSTQIIKEPNLTFFYNELKEIFPLGKYVFIIRDPRDNLRSWLNRIKLPGDMDFFDIRNADIPETWAHIFENCRHKSNGNHYIEILAYRWNQAADVYFASPYNMLLVRYEDFLSDKLRTIEEVAIQLGIRRLNNIANKIDIQYQPKGDQSISWKNFYGKKNLMLIECMCKSRMEKFGYKSKIL